MDQLLEIVKADRAALALVVLGWIAREVVALRRSVREQGQRLGALAVRVAHLEPPQPQPPAVDGGA